MIHHQGSTVIVHWESGSLKNTVSHPAVVPLHVRRAMDCKRRAISTGILQEFSFIVCANHAGGRSKLGSSSVESAVGGSCGSTFRTTTRLP